MNYSRERRRMLASAGPLFLSESHRNWAKPISIWTWTKVVEDIAERADVRQIYNAHPAPFVLD